MTSYEANAALQLAVQAAEHGEDPSRTVRRAREFYEFLSSPSNDGAKLYARAMLAQKAEAAKIGGTLNSCGEPNVYGGRSSRDLGPIVSP